MVARNVSVLALSGLLAFGAAAQNGNSGSLGLQPESRLWVEGTSTVRSFTCRAPTVNATIATSSADAVAATLSGEKAVSTVRIDVPARSLDCDNGTMNGHMLNAIKASEHPTISFRMTSYDLTPRDGSANVRLQGRLTIGGQERPITMSAEARPGANGALRLVGQQEVKLSDHGLRAPTLMMGSMRVGDAVQVKYDLLLRP